MRIMAEVKTVNRALSEITMALASANGSFLPESAFVCHSIAVAIRHNQDRMPVVKRDLGRNSFI